MDSETVLGGVALGWLITSLLLMARIIRVGRALADALAMRHPDTYEELGRPLPGFFESARRTRFAQFVGRREFESLTDGALCAEFEAYRKSEARLLIGVIASGALIAIVGVATGHAP